MTIKIYLKNGGALLMILLLLGSCKEASEKKQDLDGISTMENEKIALFDSLKTFGANYSAAWSGGNPAAVASFFAANGSLKVNDNPPAEGRDSIMKVAQAFMNAFPDMKVAMDSLVERPEGLEFHWTLTGTYAGPEGTGNKVKISGFELWHLNEEGLVETSVGHFDAKDYNRQIHGEKR